MFQRDNPTKEQKTAEGTTNPLPRTGTVIGSVIWELMIPCFDIPEGNLALAVGNFSVAKQHALLPQ